METDLSTDTELSRVIVRNMELNAQALDLYFDGKTKALTYNSTFFELGEIVDQLSQPVSNAEGVECPLWQVHAPAGITAIYDWLADEWQVPKASLQAAHGHVRFYAHELGWDMDKLKLIGRAKLGAAKHWLILTHKYGKLDTTLIARLEQGDSVSEIEQYVHDARVRLIELEKDIKHVGLGTGDEPSVNGAVAKLAQDAEDEDEETETVDTDDDGESEDDTAIREMAKRHVADQPVFLSANAVSQRSLADAMWRAINVSFYEFFQRLIARGLISMEETSSMTEDIVESIQSIFGGQMVLPLVVTLDDLPTSAGLVVLDIADPALLDRVTRGLLKQLRV